MELTNNELLAHIQSLVKNPENVELAKVNETGAGGQAAFCCGCICVSACLFNSSIGMRDLKILVEKGDIELPNTFGKILNEEIIKERS